MSDKINRLLRLYSRLRQGPVSIETIQAWARKNDINVSVRSLYRDLKEIEQAIMPAGEKVMVLEGEKNRKIWKIEFSKSSQALNEIDINNYLLQQQFTPLQIANSLRSSQVKIQQVFYTHFSKSRFEKQAALTETQVSSTHFYEAANDRKFEKILKDIFWALQNRKCIRINQLDNDFTSIPAFIRFPLLFQPIQLVYHRGLIYLTGYIKTLNELIVIGLEQIREYDLTNESFNARSLLLAFEKEMKNRFGITENINKKTYEIEIEFSEQTGNFVSSLFWHHSQQFTRLPNGNILMKIRCGINRELAGWIFQWMNNARVIKPKILRDIMQDKLKSIGDIYKSEKQLVYNNSFRPYI